MPDFDLEMTDTDKGSVCTEVSESLSTDPKFTAIESETAQGPRRSQRKGMCKILFYSHREKTIISLFCRQEKS